MSRYRVSKIRNNEGEAIESKLFNALTDAEAYALSISFGDLEHFYVLEEKTDTGIDFDEDDDYDDIKYYVNGEVGARH